MDTADLYKRLLASTLAQIYYELSAGTDLVCRYEASKVRAAGIANCGEADFEMLVSEISESANV